jgi:hypothetical protein
MTDTPSLRQVIADQIEGRLADLHTAMPGTIESYDATTGIATVAPCLKRKYNADGTVVDLPPVVGVPVLMPRGGGALISLALVKGDPVVLIFSERSLDRWISTGGKVDPKDPRKHALSDAFAFPGGYPKSRPLAQATVKMEFSATGVKISNAIGNFWFKDNADVTFDTGTVEGRFGNLGKVEFENAAGKLIDAIFTLLTTATAAGFPLVLDPTALATLTAFKEV